jgi:hypothetical protein
MPEFDLVAVIGGDSTSNTTLVWKSALGARPGS